MIGNSNNTIIGFKDLNLTDNLGTTLQSSCRYCDVITTILILYKINLPLSSSSLIIIVLVFLSVRYYDNRIRNVQKKKIKYIYTFNSQYDITFHYDVLMPI